MKTNNTLVTQVRIFVITYKRTHLLKRALESLLSQSYEDWVAEILNDDLNDISVKNLLDDLGDSRIKITSPLKKRGGTGNFNYAFDHKIEEKYACILEDDNWYEPDFLQEMLNHMEANPKIQVAVANEKIWHEGLGGNWTCNNQTIWPIDEGIRLFKFSAQDKCGYAKICNSSMFWNTKNSSWTTPPDIPIDVTEHFRERAIPHPILLITKPLVNFSVTLSTHRKRNNEWSIYQAMLIASVFENISGRERNELAQKLWKNARKKNKLHITSLMNASLVSRSSLLLLKSSTLSERWRYFFTLLRRPSILYHCVIAKSKKKESWNFLLSNWPFKQNF